MSVRIVIPTVLIATCLGCVSQTRQPEPTITPQERMTLQTRALDLLLRAAESDLDVVAGNAIEALVEVAPRDGIPAYRLATQSSSPLKRYAGYVALGEVKACDNRNAFAARVNDEHRNVRLAAAFAAYRCGRAGAARLLVETLTDSPEEHLRADAAALLGRLDEPRAKGWLRAALRYPANEDSDRVTVQIQWALANLGDRPALEELIRLSHGSTPTRTDALLLLAQLGDPQARDALEYHLVNLHEEYLETRLLAARGLGALGDPSGFALALESLTFTAPATTNVAEAGNETFVVRSLAIHALAEIGDPRALEALRNIAANETDERLQVAAAYAICRVLGRT